MSFLYKDRQTLKIYGNPRKRFGLMNPVSHSMNAISIWNGNQWLIWRQQKFPSALHDYHCAHWKIFMCLP